MNKKVIILRGIPGAGKSTHVKELLDKMGKDGLLCHEVVVCSADDTFTHPVAGGKTEYRYEPSRIGVAHGRCFGKFIDALYDEAVKVVIVDNTFIHQWEMKNYIKLANMLGTDLEIHELRANTVEEVNRCVARCVHGVPANIILRMASEFEPFGIGDIKVIPIK